MTATDKLQLPLIYANQNSTKTTQTRHRLFVILLIQVVFSHLVLFVSIKPTGEHREKQFINWNIIYILGIVHNIFGILITFNKSSIELIVFGWISIIYFLGAVASTILNIVNLIAIAENVAEKFHSFDILVFLIMFTYTLLFLCICLYTFKLAKLIKRDNAIDAEGDDDVFIIDGFPLKK